MRPGGFWLQPDWQHYFSMQFAIVLPSTFSGITCRVNYRMAGTGWDMTTIYFLVGQAANLIGVMAAPAISRKYGKKRTYMIAMLIAGYLSTGFYFIPNSITWILIFQFMISVFAGYVLPLIVVDVCRYCGSPGITYRTPCDTGLIFSSSSMSQKLGWAFGSAMSGWILAVFHYMPNAVQQSSETIFGEHIMISLMPALCCVLAFVGMLFYPLTDKKVRENSEQLTLKRNQA